jgi:hypothetical protein
MYLTSKRDGYTYKLQVIGATRLSWITGSRYDQSKSLKSGYTAGTEEAYKLSEWAREHRYNISQWVACGTPEQILRCAEIVLIPRMYKK